MRCPENALCRMCEAEETTKQADVVDDVIPHKCDQALFWDQANGKDHCRSHHSRHKQAEERGVKRRRRIGVDGYPIE